MTIGTDGCHEACAVGCVARPKRGVARESVLACTTRQVGKIAITSRRCKPGYSAIQNSLLYGCVKVNSSGAAGMPSGALTLRGSSWKWLIIAYCVTGVVLCTARRQCDDDIKFKLTASSTH